MKILDLFSGIGGFSLAFDHAGFETVAFSEIEPFPCKVLAHHWPDVPNLGSVMDIDGAEVREQFGHIDVVTFGSPCQDWSVAGKRLGLEGQRSSLFHEAIRIIRGVRPTFAIFENVPGLFSAAGGWDFAAVLDEMAESGALDIAWSVLDAQWFGVPQRRRRIFLIADFGGERAGEILFESEGMPGDFEKSREAGEGATSILEVGARTNGDGNRDGDGIGRPGDPMYTLQAGKHHGVTQELAGTLGGGSSTRGWAQDTDRMTFIPDKPLCLRNGFRDSDKREGRSGLGVKRDKAFAPQADQQHAVAFAENQRGEVRESDNLPSLSLGGGKPGVGYPAVAFTERTRKDGRNFEHQEEVAYALTNPGSGGRTHSRQLMQGMAVRRLTPRECERLQGFPDDWTNIPGASDSVRYRALGNSVAVPVVYWIAGRVMRAASQKKVA